MTEPSNTEAPTPDQLITQLRELSGTKTAGEWEFDRRGVIEAAEAQWVADVARIPDAAFIVALVNAAPALIDMAEQGLRTATEGKAEALREAAADWAANPDAWGDNEKDYRNELRDRADALDGGPR